MTKEKLENTILIAIGSLLAEYDPHNTYIFKVNITKCDGTDSNRKYTDPCEKFLTIFGSTATGKNRKE